MSLPQTAALKTMEKETARRTILEWFKFGEVDANTAFALASECSIELAIIPVDPRD